MVDAQELRRRWSDKTNAVFNPRDRYDYHEYAAENYEREFDFRGCKSIVFLQGTRTGREEDVIMLTQGAGHMTLPAGVQVMVKDGYAKCEPAGSAVGGSTVIGMGVRAPPPSRVSGYARSSADSGYSGSGRSNASFNRGSARSSYMSARSNADAGDWEVVEQLDGYQGRFRDDACSIAPSESISSVGSRGGSGLYSRR